MASRRIARWHRDVEAVLESLRPRCRGCGRPYSRIRPRQAYCTPACRTLERHQAPRLPGLKEDV